MDKIVVKGGERLIGEAPISGSKNAALPLFAASLLAEGNNVLSNVPHLKDVDTMGKVLRVLGAKIERDGQTCRIDATQITSHEAPYDLVKTMRASVLVLGPLVARMRRVRRDEVAVPQPVLAEITYGISRLPPSRRRRLLATLFSGIMRELARCPWTDDVSTRFGEVKALLERRGQRIEDFDVAIAAHALARGATLVTADRAHMPRIPGLQVEDWTAATD